MQNNGSYPPGNQQFNNNTQRGVYPPSDSYVPGNYPPQHPYPLNPYQRRQGVWNWYKRQKKGTKIGIGGGIICLVFLIYVYCLSTIIGSDASFITLAMTPTVTEINTVVPTSVQTFTLTHAQTSSSVSTSSLSASQPAQPSSPMVSPTQSTVLLPSQASAPSQAIIPQVTQVPTLAQPSTTVPVISPTQPSTTALAISPTPSPVPSQLPTPDPTTVPIVSSTQPLTPQPTLLPPPQMVQPPTQTGLNGNPWSYNFNPGKLIYSPPANFCAYFNCIKSFWQNTNGYVDECGDGTYSHSGGVAGACSRHGGEMRPLYSH